jgi:flavin reductase (DIM6/NTAB) family NADH-FMN oxidoreductase RutF
VSSEDTSRTIELDVGAPIWDRFFSVFPLVIVGTRDADGTDDLAPKHLAMPMSWDNFFGFVCTPRHRTYQNVRERSAFTVTFARPQQTVLASLAATPRCGDDSKPITAALPTIAAREVDAPLLAGGYLFLECTLDRFVDGLGDNVLIIGRVIRAAVAADAERSADLDDQDLLRRSPLLAYLYPGRFAEISATNALPVPAGFKR